MKKSGYYISILAGSIVFLNASTSHAFLPTIDASAIAEGIKSNLELVKQSKVVVDATKLTGQISSTLGEVKASISELALDELAKAKEFVEKQKENYEAAKASYEEYKKKVEEAQAELEEGKKMLEEAKSNAQSSIADAQSTIADAKDKVGGAIEDATAAYNDAKSTYEEAKDKASGFVEDATAAYNDAKGYYDTAKGYYEEGKEKLDNALDTAGNIYNTVDSTINSSGGNGASTAAPTYNSSATPTDLESAQAEIEALRAEIEKLKASQEQSGYYYNNTTESAVPQNLEEAQDEIARLREELAKYQEANQLLQTQTLQPQESNEEENSSALPLINATPTSTTNIRTRTQFTQPVNLQPLDSATPITDAQEDVQTESTQSQENYEKENSQSLQLIDGSATTTVTAPATTITEPQTEAISNNNTVKQLNPSTTLPTIKSFRQRPVIDKSTLYDINAEADGLVEETYAYSAEVSERLNFAQLDAAVGDAPTGKNDVTGEFIISQEMAQHCEVNINTATIDQLENCIKEIITYRSNPDMKIAEKGDALVDKIFYENAVGTAAAAMYAHNKASHYKEEVLIPMKQDSAEGQSDIRDDMSVLTTAQEQIQNLLIDLTKAYAAQVYQKSIKDSLSTRLQDVDPEAAAAEQSSGTATTEESSGE